MRKAFPDGFDRCCLLTLKRYVLSLTSLIPIIILKNDKGDSKIFAVHALVK